MSINPDNYLLALILWHLIFCSVLTLQASLPKGLWILAGSGPPQQTRFPSNVSELSFEAGSQEKTASRKPTVQGNRRDAQMAYEQLRDRPSLPMQQACK